MYWKAAASTMIYPHFCLFSWTGGSFALRKITSQDACEFRILLFHVNFSPRVSVCFLSSHKSYVPLFMRCSIKVYLDPNLSRLTISHPIPLCSRVCLWLLLWFSFRFKFQDHLFTFITFSQDTCYTEMWRWWIIINVAWWTDLMKTWPSFPCF